MIPAITDIKLGSKQLKLSETNSYWSHQPLVPDGS